MRNTNPRSKVYLHPLNTQQHITAGYLHYSSTQLNLQELQTKIALVTSIPVYLKYNSLQRFLNPEIYRNQSTRQRPNQKKAADPIPNNIITIDVIMTDLNLIISELRILYPPTINRPQSLYLTCRIMVFLTKDDLQHFEAPLLINTVKQQTEYSKQERGTPINFLRHLDESITIPSTNQTTSVRAILTSISLPIPIGIIIEPPPAPSITFRSADPHRPSASITNPNAITVTFHTDNYARAQAIISNL